MNNYVTERELQAHLEPMKEDIVEIKADIKMLVVGQYRTAILGPRGRMIVSIIGPVLLSITAAVLIAIYLP